MDVSPDAKSDCFLRAFILVKIAWGAAGPGGSDWQCRNQVFGQFQCILINRLVMFVSFSTMNILG